MYIIPDWKFCFLASPRTGSKAIAKVLTEKYGAILVGSHHTTPDEHSEYKLNSEWTICSTIRNHWDALISWWFKIERRGRMTPLAEFLPRFCESNPNFVSNRQLWWKNIPFTNHPLRYEHLNADLDQALVAVGLPPVDLSVITDSKRNGAPYQVFYKGATSEWVAKYFQEEIDRYGYKF